MTTLEDDVAVEVEASAEATPETGEKKKGRKRDLDFTKFSEANQQLADYVNAHSGIDPVSANQVKAILALRTDWTDTDEQKAKRAAAKEAREAAAKKYEGLTPEQITVEKAAEKQEKQAEKLRKRVEEAMQRAKAIREGKEASGEDIAAAVQADQNGAEPTPEPTPEPEPKSRRFGRK